MENQKNSSFRLDGISGLIMLVFVILAIYFIMKGVFWALSAAFPFLLAGAVILDYKGVLSFGKWIISFTKKNPMLGIVAIVVMLLAHPFVAAFLFAKSFFKWRIRKAKKDYETEQSSNFLEYEEVSTEQPKVLELPTLKQEIPKKEAPKKDADYEQLFDE